MNSVTSKRGLQPPSIASSSAQESEGSLVQFGGSNSAAGVGAVFGVAECGAVFFNTAVPGSSIWEAMEQDKVQRGDVLFSVDGSMLYRAPLKMVASKLLGPVGSPVQIVFRRGPKTITLDCQRRVTNIKAAQSVRCAATRPFRIDWHLSVSRDKRTPGCAGYGMDFL